MNTLHRAIFTLAGSALVYLIVVACSEENMRRMTPAVEDAGSNAPTSGDGPAMQPVPNVNAQPVGECAACLGSALRVTTAAEDPNQWRSGEVTMPATARPPDGQWRVATVNVVDGPFVVGELGDSTGQVYTVPASSSCAFDPASASDETDGVLLEDPNADHHWLREHPTWANPIIVLADQKLCARDRVSASSDPLPVHSLRYLGWVPWAKAKRTVKTGKLVSTCAGGKGVARAPRTHHCAVRASRSARGQASATPTNTREAHLLPRGTQRMEGCPTPNTPTSRVGRRSRTQLSNGNPNWPSGAWCGLGGGCGA